MSKMVKEKWQNDKKGKLYQKLSYGKINGHPNITI